MKKLLSIILVLAAVGGILVFSVADVNHGHGPDAHGGEDTQSEDTTGGH